MTQVRQSVFKHGLTKEWRVLKMTIVDYLVNGAVLVAAFYAAKMLFADEVESLLTKTVA